MATNMKELREAEVVAADARLSDKRDEIREYRQKYLAIRGDGVGLITGIEPADFYAHMRQLENELQAALADFHTAQERWAYA